MDPANARQQEDDKGVPNSAVEVVAPPMTAVLIRLGGLTVLPDTCIEIEIPHSANSWSDAKKYAAARGSRLDSDQAKSAKIRAAVVLPTGFDPARSWPILVVNAPGDFSSVDHLKACFLTAAECGYVAIAGDGPVSRFFTAASILDYLRASWPNVAQWPVACGGFSGGAKVSGELAAMLANSGYRVIGVWMGGCNEDYVSSGLNLYRPNPMTFKRTPLFLAVGNEDVIATPQHADGVVQSLERTGFKNIRRETYAGGHHPVPPSMVHLGLQWFLAQAEPAGRPSGRPGPRPPPPCRRPRSADLKLSPGDVVVAKNRDREG